MVESPVTELPTTFVKVDGLAAAFFSGRTLLLVDISVFFLVEADFVAAAAFCNRCLLLADVSFFFLVGAYFLTTAFFRGRILPLAGMSFFHKRAGFSRLIVSECIFLDEDHLVAKLIRV